MLNITLFGAAGEVTGSNTLLDLDGEKVVVDCGMFQGSHESMAKNLEPFHYDPKSVQAVILTHAHLDHCGRLPMLVKQGFKGTIFSTPATRDLAEIVLKDAVQIAKDRNRRKGTPIPYTLEDTMRCMDQFRCVDYNEPFAFSKNIEAHFIDAGHVLGSASAILQMGKSRVIMSGDLGSPNTPILEDPVKPDAADVVVMESTYGDREHQEVKDRLAALHDTIDQAIKRGGTILIPAFSLERTQEILYGFAGWQNDPMLKGVPVFLDSPMAIEMLDVYRRNIQEMDDEAKARMTGGHDPFLFSGLKITPTMAASKGIRHIPNPKIIIAGSGMMDGGRIQYHLFDYLPDPTTTLLVVGYQAEGTLGRTIADGVTRVLIHDERVLVRAKVEKIDYMSAHGDQTTLLNWLKPVKGVRAVILNHGEEPSRHTLAKKIEEELKLNVAMPQFGQSVRVKSIGAGAVASSGTTGYTDPA